MRVLLATDGSESSLEAIHQAGQILSPNHDELIMFYSLFGVGQISGADETLANRCRQFLGEEAFARAMEKLPGWTGAVQKILGTDNPQSEILQTAENQAVDLIVVGARGLGAIERLFLGSVSHSLAHAAKVPVLVARSNPARFLAGPYKLLLACENAVTGRYLAKFIEQFHWPTETVGRVIAVISRIPNWAVNTPRSPEIESLIEHWVQERKNELSSVRNQLAELMHALPAAFQTMPPLVVEGSAEHEILEAAKHQQTDLIVVGARTSTLWGRLFIGSTASTVLTHAACSVLLVRHT